MYMRQLNIQDLDSKKNIYLPHHFLLLWMGQMPGIIQLCTYQFQTRIKMLEVTYPQEEWKLEIGNNRNREISWLTTHALL